jgi:hypothetical protein
VRGFLAVCFIGSTSLTLLAQAPYATHPRAAPGDYAISQQTPSATFAASVVPRDEVKRLFAVDITSTYVVLEVACYPAASGSVTLAADDFLVKSGGSEFTHPADAVTVAAVIQEKNTPRLPSGTTTTVVTTATVGYESATDPVTGRRVHGTYTDVGTGVAVGGPDSGPPIPPPPGSTPYDRMTLEQQLAQRAFPSGTFSAPVAGFLYFPSKEMKRKNGVYELEYLSDASGKIRLQIPVKSH